MTEWTIPKLRARGKRTLERKASGKTSKKSMLSNLANLTKLGEKFRGEPE